MTAEIHLLAVPMLLLMLVLLNGLLFALTPRIYRWNRDARWTYLPWYVPPAPGSLRAWAEQPRPWLNRIWAGLLTVYLILAVRTFLLALALVVLHLLLVS